MQGLGRAAENSAYGQAYVQRFERVEVVERGRRRRWSDEQKLKIVVESLSGPRQVAATARRHGISCSQLVTWRRAFQAEPAGTPSAPTFVPAVIAPAAAEAQPAEPRPDARAAASRMEIVLASSRRIVVGADVDGEALAVSLLFWSGDDPRPERRAGMACDRAQRHAEGLSRPVALGPEVLRRDPLRGHLFCFRGRRGDLLKVIWHDGQGAACSPNGWSEAVSCGPRRPTAR